MSDSSLAKKLPKDVQELVSSGTYNLFHSLTSSGFIVVTKTDKNFKFDENGNYVGETKSYPDPSKYEQIYSINPSEWLSQFKSSNG